LAHLKERIVTNHGGNRPRHTACLDNIRALVGTEKETAEARRRAGMVRGYLAGEMLRSIGERYGVSWQRVHQVVARYAVRRMPLRRRACSVCGEWLYAGYICHGHVEAQSGLVLLEGGALPSGHPSGITGGLS
jgi:hypothetical protein